MNTLRTIVRILEAPIGYTSVALGIAIHVFDSFEQRDQA